VGESEVLMVDEGVMDTLVPGAMGRAAPSGNCASEDGGETSGEVMGGPERFEAVVAAEGVP
jgi:hypothetical protein